jgi:predicted nucleotidyltransferase
MTERSIDEAARIRIHALLAEAFGSRLQGVVLYGSEARGTAAPDSDADILVLLRGPVALGKDLKATIEALYPLFLELERPIHALPVDAAAYAEGEFSLYRNARREGVLV